MTEAPRPAEAPRMRLRHLRWLAPRAVIAYSLLVLAGALFLGWPLLVPGLVALFLIAFMVDAFARPASNLFYPTLTHGPRGGKRVALSFDDGPDPEETPAVLDVLAEFRAKGSFFVIGKSLATQPTLARRMLAEGHVLGNHSWQHSPWQNFYLTKRHSEEMARCEEAIAKLTGTGNQALYRPPVGLKSPELGRAAWKRGLTLVAWSVHSRDTFDRDPGSIARRVLRRVQDGDIILLHDGHHVPGGQRRHCADALRLILEGLRDKGFECVTVPELLGLPPEGARRT